MTILNMPVRSGTSTVISKNTGERDPDVDADRNEDTLALIDNAIVRIPKIGPNAIYQDELLSVLRAARKALEVSWCT